MADIVIADIIMADIVMADIIMFNRSYRNGHIVCRQKRPVI